MVVIIHYLLLDHPYGQVSKINEAKINEHNLLGVIQLDNLNVYSDRGCFLQRFKFFPQLRGTISKACLAKFVEMRMRGEIEFIYYVLKIILAVSYGDQQSFGFLLHQPFVGWNTENFFKLHPKGIYSVTYHLSQICYCFSFYIILGDESLKLC